MVKGARQDKHCHWNQKAMTEMTIAQHIPTVLIIPTHHVQTVTTRNK